MTDELKGKIYQEFNEVKSLGFEYSLADYDFFDSNHCFPNKGYGWIDANLKLQKTDLLPARWPTQDLALLDTQLENACVVEKKEHWDTVSTDYLERHWCGLAHLDRRPFLFYFPAWMLQYLRSSESLGLSSTHFFTRFSAVDFADRTWFDWMSDAQKKVAVNFFLEVSGEWQPEAGLAAMMWDSTLG